ncbi:MAG: hypothetical protein Q9163_002764 [Psora crenata]
MAQPSPDYKQLFLEAERAREEEQRRRLEAERARDEELKKTRKTTLPEFLDGCHVHLDLGLSIQTDSRFSTRGTPANADNKLRPERILAWEDFPIQQEAIWNDLLESDLVSKRRFTSLQTLEETGEVIRQRLMGSELDLNHFERSTVEDNISLIIRQLCSSLTLQKKFRLKGSVGFENHSNGLVSEYPIEKDVQGMSLSEVPPRRSPRLILAKTAQSKPPGPAEPTESAAATAASARSIRPGADQFCVYNIGGQHRVPAFIIEYKAPHKLALGHIYEGLGDMELEEVVQYRENDSPQDHFRRLVAAAITQAFSYMVRAGLEYGYVCTGQAFIFLRVPEDPRTVYYYLSIPSGDVGKTTGWAPELDGKNRLHLTALGQVLAFTLQALKTTPRGQNWQLNAAAQLKTWVMVYEDVFETMPKNNLPSSEYRPSPQRKHDYLRKSPVQLRPRLALGSSAGCHPPEGQTQSSDDEFDPDTPSRRSQQPQGQSVSTAAKVAGSDPSTSTDGPDYDDGGRQYCTQSCLLGLAKGGLLDSMCPNVQDHGETRHQINKRTFLSLLRKQLSTDLDTDVEPTGIHGARGALFKVSLTSHGYTLAAKCTTIDFVANLRHEATIYKRLSSIQGIHIPVYLGNLDLVHPYSYLGFATIVHMMFLSFGGTPFYPSVTADNQVQMMERLERSIQAIHQLGVQHRDMAPRNILWHTELSQVMIIDFERAEVLERRVALGTISPNRRGKRSTKPGESSPWPKGGYSKCGQELREAMNELRTTNTQFRAV